MAKHDSIDSNRDGDVELLIPFSNALHKIISNTLWPFFLLFLSLSLSPVRSVLAKQIEFNCYAIINCVCYICSFLFYLCRYLFFYSGHVCIVTTAVDLLCCAALWIVLCSDATLCTTLGELLLATHPNAETIYCWILWLLFCADDVHFICSGT